MVTKATMLLWTLLLATTLVSSVIAKDIDLTSLENDMKDSVNGTLGDLDDLDDFKNLDGSFAPFNISAFNLTTSQSQSETPSFTPPTSVAKGRRTFSSLMGGWGLVTLAYGFAIGFVLTGPILLVAMVIDFLYFGISTIIAVISG